MPVILLVTSYVLVTLIIIGSAWGASRTSMEVADVNNVSQLAYCK
jgi:hypothetical protein